MSKKFNRNILYCKLILFDSSNTSLAYLIETFCIVNSFCSTYNNSRMRDLIETFCIVNLFGRISGKPNNYI